MLIYFLRQGKWRNTLWFWETFVDRRRKIWYFNCGLCKGFDGELLIEYYCRERVVGENAYNAFSPSPRSLFPEVVVGKHGIARYSNQSARFTGIQVVPRNFFVLSYLAQGVCV